MRNNGLRPRATTALAVVAASLFLLLCLANYGQGGFETAGDAPWHLGLAGWFVEVFGAGAFALVLLPLVWGLVVYFREDTPSLSMRAAGTVLLACSISMISGLVQGAAELSWAGSVGEYTVALTGGLGSVMGEGLALALAWAAAVTLFLASLIWATDWWFHSLRKGPVVPVIATTAHIDVEPLAVELRDDEAEEYEREHVSVPTAGAQAAGALGTEPAPVDEPLPAEEMPEGFSVRQDHDRMVVRGPSGYAGVEFLPPSDELAPPEPPEERYLADVDESEERMLDDEIEVTAAEDGATESSAEPEAIPDLTADDEVDVEVEEAAAETFEPEREPETPAARATDTEPIFVDDVFEIAAEAPADAPAPTFAEAAASQDARPTPPPEPVAAAEETASAAEPEPEPEAEARPRSGIGLPEDSPFVDEVFTVDVLVTGGGDGASADGEVEAAFGTSIPASESPESAVVAEPEPSATEPSAPVVERPAPVIVDELLFADAYDVEESDENVPGPIAARSAPPAKATPGLGRIGDMQLDPLFHDAVEVVLENGRGTAMTLQRRFGIGHGRGLRLLEQMETAGILAPEDDAGTRAVRIERAEWEAFTGSGSA